MNRIVAALSIPALLLATSARALPLETADLLSQGFESHILDIMPQAKFSVDERMRKNVEFWVRIYTEYTTSQGLIHDAKYIDHVYEIIDFQKLGLDPNKGNKKFFRQIEKKWKDVLLSVHKKQDHPEEMNEVEKRVFEMYADINEPDKFLQAAGRKRLRFQLGQKDRFLDGLKQSGRYLPIMEDIFRASGLPTELTRLPFVESSFNVRARSKVGASGIWQFMRGTARIFGLKVNDAIDERNDPIRATEAAARLLKSNYDRLKTWPLAVTAYNHGTDGMARAVRKIGSDELEDITSEYKSRRFGFASSNFFTELLAAIEVERNAGKYFGKVDREKPLQYVEVTIPDFIALADLMQFLHLDESAIRELNPGLHEAVLEGHRMVPANYHLRLPYDGKTERDSVARVFMAGYDAIPASFKEKRQGRPKYATKARLTTKGM